MINSYRLINTFVSDIFDYNVPDYLILFKITDKSKKLDDIILQNFNLIVRIDFIVQYSKSFLSRGIGGKIASVGRNFMNECCTLFRHMYIYILFPHSSLILARLQ